MGRKGSSVSHGPAKNRHQKASGPILCYHGKDLLRSDGLFHLLLTVADQGVIAVRQMAQDAMHDVLAVAPPEKHHVTPFWRRGDGLQPNLIPAMAQERRHALAGHGETDAFALRQQFLHQRHIFVNVNNARFHDRLPSLRRNCREFPAVFLFIDPLWRWAFSRGHSRRNHNHTRSCHSHIHSHCENLR